LIDFLLNRLAPGWRAPGNAAARARVGVAAGGMGIALNLLLFAAKLAVGLLSGSVAILSDAFNNISDTGSSLVALIGMRLAARRPDREHPFGHGRAEYVSALIVAMMILLVALELVKASVEKLIAPEAVSVSPAVLAVLAASVVVKLAMFGANRALARRIGSSVLTAAAADSLNDAVVTSLILAGAFAGARFGWNLDAPAGILVSLFIFYGGIRIAREVVSLLLGGKADPALERAIAERVLAAEGILGVHDLIVHDYGPGRQMASVHAEVDEAAGVRKIHEAIDAAERRILKELGVPVVIHMDPVAANCDETNAARARMVKLITDVNPRFTLHDFRVTRKGGHTRVSFDLAVPGDMPEAERARALEAIKRAAKAEDPGCRLVVQVDSRYDA
jgi:cation diffusion facilitator family transporter